MTQIKICGLTNKADAWMAVEAGANALGFVFTSSPRQIDPMVAKSIIESLPPFIITVGVFVNQPKDEVEKIARMCKLDRLQFHGDETPEYCDQFSHKVIKAFRIQSSRDIEKMANYKVCAYLLDSYEEGREGGTGKPFDWSLAEEAAKYGQIILAGGLNPDNVKRSITNIRPYGVDVSSGVEKEPGIKSKIRVTEFVRSVQNADSEIIITDKTRRLFEMEEEEAKEQKPKGFLFWGKK